MTSATTHDIEINGVPYLLRPGTYRRFPASQFAPKLAQGDTKHQDFSIKSVITQEDWHGGRAQRVFEDVTRFYDSENVQTRIKNQVTLAPRPIKVGISADYPEYEPASVGSNVALCDQPLKFETEPVESNPLSVYGSYKVARSFTTDAGGMKVGYVHVKIRRDAGNTGKNAKVTLYTDSSGPNTVVTNATCTLTWSTISTSFAWVKFTFAAQITLAASTKYWIVLEESSGTASAPRYWWYGPAFGVGLPGSNTLRYDGASWANMPEGCHYKFGYRPKALSQKFTMPASDMDVTYLTLRLKLTGTKPYSASSITVRVETDNAGMPSGTLLTDTGRNASWTISTADFNSAGAYYWIMTNVFTTANHITFASGAVYHIVIYRPDGASQDDDSWDIQWANDNVGTIYAGTAADESWHFSSGLTSDAWAALAGDFGFRLESGYTPLGSITNFCYFFGALYAASGTKLYRLLNTGATFTQVQYGSSPYDFPATITDMIAYDAAGTDNQQVLTATGTVSGGGFNFTWQGYTVSNINYACTAAGLQNTIELYHDKIEPGDILCTGGPMPASPITITFGGRYLNKKVQLATIGQGTLSGGGSYSVVAPASYMLIACDRKPIVQMKSNEVFVNGDATVKAKLFATLRDRVYALTDGKIVYNTDGQVGATSWYTSADLGNAATMVTGAAELDGVLYIAKEDGLQRLVSDQEATMMVPWPDLLDTHNGKSMKAWQGSLVFPLGHGLMKFTAGQIAPIGLDLDEGLPPGKQGYVRSLAAAFQTLYTGIGAGQYNRAGVYEYNGVGWHNLWTAEETGKQIGAMIVTNKFGEENRLWFSHGADVYYQNIPDVTDNPVNWLNDDGDGLANFVDSGWLETGWIQAGLPEVTKNFITLAIEAKVPAGQIEVLYHCDESTEYRTLGTIAANGVSTFRLPLVSDIGSYKKVTSATSATVFRVAYASGIAANDILVINGHERLVSGVTTDGSTYDELTISAGLPVVPEVGDLVLSGGRAGKQIQFRFILSTTDSTKTPVLKRWTLSQLARPETVWAWQFQIRAANDMEYKNGTGAYPYTLDQVVEELRVPMDIPMSVPFRDPWGNEFEVFVTDCSEQEISQFTDTDGSTQYERVVPVALIAL